MGHPFWLSDEQWAAIEPLLPANKGGARGVDDGGVISGIIHALQVGFGGATARKTPAFDHDPTSLRSANAR